MEDENQGNSNAIYPQLQLKTQSKSQVIAKKSQTIVSASYDSNKQEVKSRRKRRRSFQESLRTNFEIVCKPIDKFRNGEALNDKYMKIIAKYINVTPPYLYIEEMNYIEMARHYQDNYPLLGFRKFLLLIQMIISQSCLWIVKSSMFETISLTVILANSILLIFQEPNASDSDSDSLLTQLDFVFLILYTIEMGLKVFAYGFIMGPKAYIRDTWNILDFIIVTTAYLPYVLGSSTVNLKSLRFTRILRPLRTITSIRALKVIMRALFSALPMLCDSFSIVLFVFLIFGIGGLQLWQGLFKLQCFHNEYGFPLFQPMPCGNYDCPKDYICGKMLENPNDGTTNFDNILYSFLQVFIVTTLEGWTDIMNYVDATFSPFARIYFFSLIFIGAYFLLNIILAVIKAKFTDTQTEETDEEYKVGHIDPSDQISVQLQIWDTATQYQVKKIINQEFYFNFNQIKQYPRFYIPFHKLRNMQRNINQNLEQPDSLSPLLNNSVEDPHSSLNQQNNSISLLHPNDKAPYQYSSQQNLVQPHPDIQYASLNQNSKRLTGKQLTSLQLDQILNPSQIQRINYIPQNQHNPNNTLIKVKSSDKLIKLVKQQNLQNYWSGDRFAELVQDFKEKSVETSQLDNTTSIKNHNLSAVEHNQQDQDNVVNQEYLEIQNNLIDTLPPHYAKIFVHIHEIPIQILSTSYSDVLNRSTKYRDQQKKISLLIAMKLKKYQYNIPTYQLNPILDEIHSQNNNIKARSDYNNKGSTVADSMYEESRLPMRRNRLKKKMNSNESTRSINIRGNQEQLILDVKYSSQRKDYNYIYRDYQLQMVFGVETPIVSDVPEYAIIYEQIKETEFYEGIRSAILWSGFDVLNQSFYQIQRTNKIINRIQDQNKVIWVLGIKGIWMMAQYQCLVIIKSKEFEDAITMTVFLNTSMMCIQSFYDDQNPIFLFFNNIFTSVFATEMALKLLAMGVREYLRDSLNILDGLIVVLSFVEIFIFSGGGSAAGAFKAFRTFRVLRVTKLFKALEFMKIIIKVVVRSFSSFIYISILLFLFTFIYALIGRTLYQGKCELYGEAPLRSNFDSFSQGLITVFQLLTLENWNQILYVLIRCDVYPVITCIFLVSWIFIGNYILLNLFLAILLDGFTNAQIQEDDEEEAHCDAVLDPRGFITSDEWDHFFYKLQKKTGNKGFNLKIIAKVQPKKKVGVDEEPKEQEVVEHRNNQNDESVEIKLHKAEKLKKKNQLIQNYAQLKCEESLWIFPKNNWFRRMCYRIVSWSQFETIILLLIGLSSLKLIYDTYLPTSATTPEDILRLDISKALDYFFNISFVIEMVLKIVSFGCLFEEDTYFKDFWNILDGFIVFSSIIDMTLDGVDLAAVKILRLLRTLRPLRFVSHNINMKIVVNALLQSVGSILNVLIVVFLLWLMFAILGTALFKERLNYCDADVYFDINIQQCEKEWVIQRNNYEHVANASLTLFVVATLEGWPDYMYQAIDSDLQQYGPHKNQTQAFAIFYVVFILIGSFFLLNLFVGALCYNFDKAQKNEKTGGISFMTLEQQKWIELNLMLRHAEPEVIGKWVPQKGIRNSLYKFIQSNEFEVFIMTVILLNIILMSLDYEGSPANYQTVLETINLVFTFTFILESILKIMALTPRGYLDSGWNQFDCFIVCSSIVDLIVGFVGGNSLSILSFGPQLIRIIRVFRITRILRLVKQLKGMQKLIETIMISLPSLLNVGALLLLIMFIYSILGWFLFNGVKEGWKIGEYYNFNNFGSSILTLFRCLTGEDWPMIMYDVMRTDQSCIPGKTCGSIYSIPFFISYILICTFVMLNLFILIVLQNFEEYNLKKNNPLESFTENLEAFQIVWAKYSIEHQGVRINKKYLRNMLVELAPPLGVGSAAEKQVATKLIQMDLREDRMNCLYFNDIFYELMKIAYGGSFNEEINQTLINKMLESEQKTKSALFAKKKQNYSKILEEKEFHTYKINPFFRDIFMKTVFLSWIHYSQRQQVFISRKAKNGQTIHHINQLKRQFLIPSDESSGSEFDHLNKRSQSESESESQSYCQRPQYKSISQSRNKNSIIHNNSENIKGSPVKLYQRFQINSYSFDRSFFSFRQQDDLHEKEDQIQNPLGISISDYSQNINQGSQSVQNNQIQKKINTKSRPNSVSSYSHSRRVSFEDEIGQIRSNYGNQVQRDDKQLNEVIFEDAISQQSNQGERKIEEYFKSIEFDQKQKHEKQTFNSQESMEKIEQQFKSIEFDQKQKHEKQTFNSQESMEKIEKQIKSQELDQKQKNDNPTFNSQESMEKIEKQIKQIEFDQKQKNDNPTFNSQESMEKIEKQIKQIEFDQKSENKQSHNHQSQLQILESQKSSKGDNDLDMSNNIINISPDKQLNNLDTKLQIEIDSMLSSPVACLNNEVSNKFSQQDNSIIKRDQSQAMVNSELQPNIQIRFASVKPPKTRVETIQIKPQIRKTVQESSSSLASGGLSIVVQGKQFENIILPQEQNESFDQVKNNLLQKMNFQQQGNRAQQNQNQNQNQKMNFYETAYVGPTSKSQQYGTQYGVSKQNAFNFANSVNQAYDFIKLDQQLSPNKGQEVRLSPIKGQEGRVSPNKRQDISKVQDQEVEESHGKEIKTRQRQKMNQIISAYNDERRVRFRTPENGQKQ